MKIEIVQIFDIEDKDFGGDYLEVEVYCNGDLISEYGDHYHDKGLERAEGFVDGFLIGADVNILNVTIARLNRHEEIVDDNWEENLEDE